MTDDLDTLRPEVRKAVAAIDKGNGVFVNGDDCDGGIAWATARAELLRLEGECGRLDRAWQCVVNQALENGQRAKRAEAELAALKAKIEVAPVVACTKTLVHAGNTMQTEFLEYTHERMPGGCNSWAGKRVRLVVEE